MLFSPNHASAPDPQGHMAPPSLTAALKRRASEIGFELVGVAPAVRAGTWENLDEWLGRGFAGEMKYIERRREAYQHPEHVLPQVRSVVMLGLVYGSGGARGESRRQEFREGEKRLADGGGIRPWAESGPLSPASDFHTADGYFAGERDGVRGPHRTL